MYQGTLATRGPWQALVTFQQMVILADKHGCVDMTSDAISRITTIPLEIIETGLQELSKPDSESRSPAEDGRRIVPLADNRTWGWKVVNYEHYRKIRSEEERREYHRQYMRKRRSVNENVKVSTGAQQSQPIAVSSMQEAVSNKKKKQATPLPTPFEISPEVKTWALQKGHSNLEAYREFFIGRMSASGKLYVDWDQAFMNCIREDWPEFRKEGSVPAKRSCSKCGTTNFGSLTQTSEGMICGECRYGREDENTKRLDS